MNDCLVCYIDTDGVNKYTTCDSSDYIDEKDEFDIAAYAADNGLSISSITNVFNKRDNLISKSYNEKERFENYCTFYGFEKGDYKAQVRYARTNEILIFTGFLPRNRKYKALLRNAQTGKCIKATLDYVKRNIIGQKENNIL